MADNTKVPLIWPDIESVAVLPASHFVAQVSASEDGNLQEFILSVGFATPPVVMGTPKEQEAMQAAIGAVSVKAHARFVMTRGRLDELASILEQTKAAWDARDEAETQGNGDGS